MATPDTMVSATGSSHFRGPQVQDVESYAQYANMREPGYSRYGGQLPPTPEEGQHYNMSASENYPPQPAPVQYQPQAVTAYTMHEPRRASWQTPEYNPGQQLPPMNPVPWSSHAGGQMVSPVQMSGYGGWPASAQQQQSTLLPPMQPSMQDHQQPYQDPGAFMKCESQNSQQG